MPFSDQTEYPRGIFSKIDLTNVAVDVGTPSEDKKISHYILQGGGSLETIIFRSSAGAEFFRLQLQAAEVLIISRGFQAVGGLELLTLTAAGDVNVTIFYLAD